MSQLPAEEIEHEVSVIWAMHDFTDELGATRAVPGRCGGCAGGAGCATTAGCAGAVHGCMLAVLAVLAMDTRAHNNSTGDNARSLSCPLRVGLAGDLTAGRAVQPSLAARPRAPGIGGRRCGRRARPSPVEQFSPR